MDATTEETNQANQDFENNLVNVQAGLNSLQDNVVAEMDDDIKTIQGLPHALPRVEHNFHD